MTGSLRTDLLLWLARADEEAPRFGPATFRGLVGEASEPELEQVAEQYDGAGAGVLATCIVIEGRPQVSLVVSARGVV